MTLILAGILCAIALLGLLPMGVRQDCPAGHEIEGPGYLDEFGDIWCSQSCIEDAAEKQADNDAERRIQ